MQEELKELVRRSLQLLGLIRLVSFQSNCEFHELLVQDNTFFEVILFTEVRRFEQRATKAYESDFNALVGSKFFRIVNLYYKIIKARDEKEVKEMCEEFGSLPSYFMDYLRIHRGYHTEAMRVDVFERSAVPESQRRRMLSEGTPAEQYEAMLSMIR